MSNIHHAICRKHCEANECRMHKCIPHSHISNTTLEMFNIQNDILYFNDEPLVISVGDDHTHLNADVLTKINVNANGVLCYENNPINAINIDSHSHLNTEMLSKFSVDNGVLLYDGHAIYGTSVNSHNHNNMTVLSNIDSNQDKLIFNQTYVNKNLTAGHSHNDINLLNNINVSPDIGVTINNEKIDGYVNKNDPIRYLTNNTTLNSVGLCLPCRSEERRVGKECRR